MDPLLKDILTIGFSTVSLIISVVSLVITLLNYRRQGGVIKYSLDYEKDDALGTFVLKIANQGFHSIKIVGIKMITRKAVIPYHENGFEVIFGQESVIRMTLAGHTEIHPLEVYRIDVTEISGKVHKIKTNSIRKKIRSSL